MSGAVVVATVWLAYKKNLEQLARFIQLTCEGVEGGGRVGGGGGGAGLGGGARATRATGRASRRMQRCQPRVRMHHALCSQRAVLGFKARRLCRIALVSRLGGACTHVRELLLLRPSTMASIRADALHACVFACHAADVIVAFGARPEKGELSAWAWLHEAHQIRSRGSALLSHPSGIWGCGMMATIATGDRPSCGRHGFSTHAVLKLPTQVRRCWRCCAWAVSLSAAYSPRSSP